MTATGPGSGSGPAPDPGSTGRMTLRRRLTFALVGTALTSIVLVGAGVLVLAQIGARGQAANQVSQRLEAVSELLAGSSFPDRGLDRARAALQLHQLELVGVDDGGVVTRLIPTSGNGDRRSPRGPRVAAESVAVLSPDQLDDFRAGAIVIVDSPDDDLTVVLGVRRLEDIASGVDGVEIGLVAGQSVVTISRQARVWFGLSAIAAVGLSLAVAWFLASRLVRPIYRIQGATAAIAAGDFATRVDVEGDDELAGLGRSVNRMATELERSRAVDQQFLMSVSHDLRTPLTAISGYAEALRDGAVDDTSRAGAIIGDHAGRLERLVGDLLDLAKLDAKRFALHSQLVDATVVVGRAVAGRSPAATHHGLDLRFTGDGPAMVMADADRLTQIIDNVVDNAITFAHSTITVSVAPEPENRIVVTVVDDGPGIAAEDLPHVFERLYVSAAQPARAESPSGLGLAIVRELTTAMGGVTRAISEPGSGTRIEVVLPAV